MSLTQVSTWFANARRRLKKESGNKEDTSDDSMDGKGEKNYLLFFHFEIFLDDTADESALSVVDVEPTVHVTPSLARERESKQEEATESKEEEALPEDRSSSSTPPSISEASSSTAKPKIWRIVDHIQND